MANDAHGALRVGQGDIGGIGPAVLRQTVEQNEGGYTFAVQAFGQLVAFMVEIVPGKPPARDNQHSRAIRLGSREDGQTRPRHTLGAPEMDSRIGGGFFDDLDHVGVGLPFDARGPQVDRRRRFRPAGDRLATVRGRRLGKGRTGSARSR